MLRFEPVWALQSVVITLNVLQQILIGVPTWAHALIIAASAGLGAYATRARVTPY